MSLGVVYIFLLILAFGLGMLGWLVSYGGGFDEEKMSSFECGFVSFFGSRLSFSLQFFLIAIIFLVFDVEIALILPVVVLINASSIGSVVMVVLVFGVVVLGGLYYEWGAGVLDWAN